MKRKRVLWGAAAALCLVLYLVLFPSDERLIRRQVDALIEHSSKKAEEHPLVQFRRADLISRLFREPATIAVYRRDQDAEVRTYSNAALNEKIAALRNKMGRLDLKVGSVRIEPRGKFAIVEMNLHGEGNLLGESAQLYDDVNLRLKYTKEDGEWKIAEAENVLRPEGGE